MAHRFQLRIDETQYEKLETICNEEDRSVNRQICQLIKQYIKAYEKENGEVEIKE